MRSISSDLSSDPPGAPTGFLLPCSQKSGSGMSPCPGHTGHVPAGISGQSPGSEDQTQSDTSRASNSPPSQTTESDLDKHARSYLQPVLSTTQLGPGHVLLLGGGGVTFWEMMEDYFLGKSCKTALHGLAEDFLTGWGERRDLKEVQPWEGRNAYITSPPHQKRCIHCQNAEHVFGRFIE